MTETTLGPGPQSCANVAPLIEKRFADDPLSFEEQRSLERHLGECKGCREMLRWSVGLSTVAENLSPAELDTAVYAALAESRRHRLLSQKRLILRTAYIGAASFVAAAAVWAAVWFEAF